jgi:putative ABC transport system ATP-binding protein
MGGQNVAVVCNISFTIYQNDFVCLLGPSGSGKSTLLHIMGLLDRPTTGNVFINGTDTNNIFDEEQARLRGSHIGFVFQTFNLINSLTAMENVELPMILYDVPPLERNARARELLVNVGLGHRLNHYPSQLSGGERQRVAIARALVNNPEIILADEPTGNLDSKTGQEVLDVFAALHKDGKTIVIITHDESITGFTQRLLRIRDGKLLKDKVHRV